MSLTKAYFSAGSSVMYRNPLEMRDRMGQLLFCGLLVAKPPLAKRRKGLVEPQRRPRLRASYVRSSPAGC
eukprot:1718601-Pyramimonas_sp.AAC.1